MHTIQRISKSAGNAVLAVVLLVFASAHAQRQMERMGRGVVALRQDATKVYVGWRLLADDPDDIAFNVYRSTNGSVPVKLNDAALIESTNYVDDGANLAQSNSWFIRPVLDSQEMQASASCTLPENPPVQNYIAIQLQGLYTFDRASVGDLDGDGEYDYVIKQPHQVTDPGVYERSTDTWKIEAYRSDGAFLWRRDLGWNIVQGIWWSPMIVYDLDGDGAAEVVTKTAPVDVDYRRASDGRVLQGPEWFTVFDGRTGQALAQEDWIPRGNICDWGDCYGNRVNRNLMCVAYLDGERPSLVIFRGTYGLMKAEAWNFRDGRLENVWRWSNQGLGTSYQGQGFHSIRVGDIDGDGRDEILNGSIAIDDDGVTLYSTGEGHGDRFHLADIDPARPGLETWYIQEDDSDYTHPVHLRDARTGTLLWGLEGNWGDVGRGLVADIDPYHEGLECWSPQGDLYTCRGWPLGAQPDTCQFAVWWDADVLRELVEDGRIYKWDPASSSLDRIGSTLVYRYSDKLVADVIGDWREEIITVPEEGGELRVYTTTIPSHQRFRTFMHDPVYRVDVASMGMGYTQSAHLSFYLGSRDQGIWPFSLPAAADVQIGNDADLGPDRNDDSSGLHIRSIEGRRRVTYIQYDLSGLKCSGAVFSGLTFSNYGHDPGPVDVYGLLHDYDDISLTSLSWTVAPGVRNDPMPLLDAPVELDPTDLTDRLLNFVAPARGLRTSTEPSQALDDYLNDDNDGNVVLVFAPPSEGDQAILRSSEHDQGGTFLEGFIQCSNDAPVVDAGRDQYTWLGNATDLHSAAVQIDATVTDDGLPSGELTVIWEQIDEGPEIAIERVNPEDPTAVRLSIPATGDYQIQLTASDTDFTTSDRVLVFVRETPCLAARAMDGWEPIVGDFDLNCTVDLDDLAQLAQNWLMCNSLMCP